MGVDFFFVGFRGLRVLLVSGVSWISGPGFHFFFLRCASFFPPPSLSLSQLELSLY